MCWRGSLQNLVGFALPVSSRRHYGEWVSLCGRAACLPGIPLPQSERPCLRRVGEGLPGPEVGTGGVPADPQSAPSSSLSLKAQSLDPMYPPTPEGGAGGGTSTPGRSTIEVCSFRSYTVLLDSGGTCDLPGKLLSSIQCKSNSSTRKPFYGRNPNPENGQTRRCLGGMCPGLWAIGVAGRRSPSQWGRGSCRLAAGRRPPATGLAAYGP